MKKKRKGSINLKGEINIEKEKCRNEEIIEIIKPAIFSYLIWLNKSKPYLSINKMKDFQFRENNKQYRKKNKPYLQGAFLKKLTKQCWKEINAMNFQGHEVICVVFSIL